MKKKADKRGKLPQKLEKKNKILDKGELEALFSKEKEDKNSESYRKRYTQPLEEKPPSILSQKETKTQNNESNLKMFTEGVSYENIDQNKYNKALYNFNFLFKKDLNKNNKPKKAEQEEKSGQISKKYLKQRGLYKEIEIEIKLNNENKKIKKDSIDDAIQILNNFFIKENNFVYYEYSNSKNISFNKFSEVDMLYFRYYYDNHANFTFANNLYNKKEEYLKKLDYTNTLNNLFYKYNIDKKLFFIITPFSAFSFDYNRKIPLLLTNSKTLEVELKQNNIKAKELKYKKNVENKNKEIINPSANKKDNIEVDNNQDNNNDKNDIVEGEIQEPEINNLNAPFGIPKLYVGRFYNYFVNENSLKPFNIFSNFEYEGSVFRKCKCQIIKLKKAGEINEFDSIVIKIEGIIFDENIINIIDFFKNKIDIQNYSVRLNKIKSTNNFYFAKKEIEASFDKFEFKNGNFYYYKK